MEAKLQEASQFKLGNYNNIIVAIALFDKQVSHLQYYRENLAREKFEKLYAVKPNFVDHTR